MTIKTSIDDETLMEMAKRGITASTPVAKENNTHDLEILEIHEAILSDKTEQNNQISTQPFAPERHV